MVQLVSAFGLEVTLGQNFLWPRGSWGLLEFQRTQFGAHQSPRWRGGCQAAQQSPNFNVFHHNSFLRMAPIPQRDPRILCLGNILGVLKHLVYRELLLSHFKHKMYSWARSEGK